MKESNYSILNNWQGLYVESNNIVESGKTSQAFQFCRYISR